MICRQTYDYDADPSGDEDQEVFNPHRQRMLEFYTNSGYRPHSNKYKIIARVDRPDWMTHMAIMHSPWSLDEGLRWIIGMGLRHAVDHYQSTLSQDVIEGVPYCVYRALKKAPPLHDFVDYDYPPKRRRGMDL